MSAPLSSGSADSSQPSFGIHTNAPSRACDRAQAGDRASAQPQFGSQENMHHQAGDRSKTRPQFVLASSSPSRRSILQGAGISPLCVSPEVDEDAIMESLAGLDHADIVAGLAKAKAQAILASGEHSKLLPAHGVVVAADSMLLLDGHLQGKPHTIENTIARWRAQRGKQAKLLTGHCIAKLGSTSGLSDLFVETSTTTLHFGNPSDEDITAYAHSGEPLLCAGAFTLEAMGGWFIDRIDGDPSSVIGLSLPTLRRALYHFSFSVSDVWH